MFVNQLNSLRKYHAMLFIIVLPQIGIDAKAPLQDSCPDKLTD
jgi:hypothetical protein